VADYKMFPESLDLYLWSDQAIHRDSSQSHHLLKLVLMQQQQYGSVQSSHPQYMYSLMLHDHFLHACQISPAKSTLLYLPKQLDK
jgi:hypothetical protein